MIYGNINELKFYKGISEGLDKAIEVIEAGAYINGTPGKNEVLGDEVFFNIADTETKIRENCLPETHKDYLDIHVIIEGEELIGYSATTKDLVEETPYVKESDIAFLKGETDIDFHVDTTKFAIFFQDEIHRPLMAVNNEPKKIKKAIFKIKVK